MSAARKATAKRVVRKKTAPSRKKPTRAKRRPAKATAAPERSEELLVTPPAAPEVQPSDLRNVGFVRKVMRDGARTLREAMQWKLLRKTPYGLMPIGLLALLALVKGFDGQIFFLVLPDIVRDLNLDVTNVLTVVNLLGFLLIFAVVTMGFVMDRVPRLPFLAGGTFISGLTTALTPTSKGTVSLGAYQSTSTVGDQVSGIPEFSLISDYYPPESRGRAFAMYGAASTIGAKTAPWLFGLVAINYGWRWPFYITGPLLMVGGIVLFFVLKEPVRGFMERRAAGLSAAEQNEAEPPPSFGHAMRVVWGVQTLRRLFIGNIAGFVGDRLYAFVIPIFLFEQLQLDVLERGKIISFAGVFTVIGLFIGGGVVDSLMGRRPQRVLIFLGFLGILDAVTIAIKSTAPPLGWYIVVSALFGFTSAFLGPARSVLYGQIIPAHVRTLGGSVFALGAIPGVIITQIFITRIPDWGIRGVLFSAAPFVLLGALIDLSAARLFERDMRSAIASQTATAEFKRAKAAGTVRQLVCREVDVAYDGAQVLFNVDFTVDEGEIVALLGTNGAGKSTLLRAISGSHEASGGAIIFDGRDITHVPPYEVAERGIVHMPGGRGIFPGLSVTENLRLGTWIFQRDGEREHYVDPEHLKDIDLDEVLTIFPSLRPLLDRPAGALSGGEQQMVSLAQAFLQRPRLLLIDELSLGLSPAVVQQLLESVREINRRGVTIVVVEQSVNVALTIAERAVFMEKGEVKFVGKTKDLLARPDILRAVYVKGTGALTSQPGGSTRKVQRVLEDRRVVLSVEGLKKSFGGVTAVDDVSFELHDEEILGLIGPNGAGKTTIFDLISGYITPDDGKVIFEGNDVTTMPPDQRARLQLVRRFQDAKLFPSLTVYETLLVALDRRQDVRNMAVIALQLPQVRASERRVRHRADQLIELLGIGAYRDKFVKELSTGLRRVTDLACVLAAEPRALLLDEPSSGIAQAEAESLGPLLQRVRRETGCSILIIEHDMPLISRVADELIALDQGRVVMRDTPEAVLNDPRVIESYLGTSEAVIRRSGART